EKGNDRIRDGAFVFLNEISALLRRFNYDVLVEGHTDSRPTGSLEFPTKWELSTARAVSVVRYLAEVGGVDPRRMGASGYADMRPVSDEETEEARARNRRVEFLCHQHPSLSRPEALPTKSEN
ncbi:MAG: OmpA family protein, partial [Myxococcota bacterium]